ncbi:replication initiator protein [Blackfly microvirus SF02]|uniref:Replication initiator protein n=1 Tax=Blackfly microvirus SF02 TaxID=2576452 RepID=A0A4V1F5H0_9VIRU|nr:replication initiator protein [Blackfly microvirus SF02]
MTCFRPLTAYQNEDGAVVFHERGKIRRELSLPCGRCIGCRVTRSRMWAVRCVHESKCHDVNSFVTLTYDDDHYSPSLCYRDFQLFIKRLRAQSASRVRFFCAGEYGEQTQRPHFHALLFGKTFAAREKIGKTIWRSPELEKLWPMGFSSFGDVTFQSAAYVAKYSVKKINGDQAEEYYKRVDLQTGEIVSVVPEFGRMSLKPGIGKPWFDKYWKDVYAARDRVILDGKEHTTPRYYDELLSRIEPYLSDEKEYERYVASGKFLDDCTPERLDVRERVALAKYEFETIRKLK